MTIHDSTTLAPLIAAYPRAIVFESSVPNPFRMAKIFCQMHQSNGGLVLCGVLPDGSVCGLDAEDVEDTYEAFESLCADLTRTRVEIGTLAMRGRTVVFLVFNTKPSNLTPLRPYAGWTSRVAMI